jgi:peptidoglycan hydrolase-like protein with peptidoglycan-binding domain
MIDPQLIIDGSGGTTMTPLWVKLAVAALLVVPIGAGAQPTAKPQPVAPMQSPERPVLDRLLPSGDIQVAEAHLRQMGFDPGPIDGIFTAQTQAAVRAYQARYGLPVSGLLDLSTRQELKLGVDPLRTG